MASSSELVEELDNGEEFAKTYASVKDNKGRTVLHFAAAEGDYNICEYLINQIKIDIDMRDDIGNTPLHHAILGEHPSITQYLIQSGADISLSNFKGYTPLHHAAEKGHTEILKLLISKGAAIDSISESGTPLQCAAAEGKKDAVKVLLAHNANPNSVSHQFFSALILSVLAKSPECLLLLLEAGADPNVGAFGVTPLGQAIGDRQIRNVGYLLEYGADPNAVDTCGLTPLEHAALHNYHEGVRILFPQTCRIQSYPEWSISGIMRHIHSEEARAQRETGRKESFQLSRTKGKEAFAEKEYVKAIFWYSKALTIDPNDGTLFSNRSLCWARLNEGGPALSDAEDCVRLKPNWSKGHYRRGAALKILKDYSMAAVAFADALQLDPDNKEIEKELMEVSKLNSTRGD